MSSRLTAYRRDNVSSVGARRCLALSLNCLLAGLLALSIVASHAAKPKPKPNPKPPQTLQFELVSTRGNPPRTTVQRVFIKDNLRRVELVGLKHVRIFDGEAITEWGIGQKEAMRFPVAKGRGLPILVTDAPGFWKDAKKVGTEELQGRRCDVYDYQPAIPPPPPNMPAPQPPMVRVWVWTEHKLALKTVASRPGQPEGTMEVRKLVVGKPIPDGYFKLPKWVTVKKAPMPPVGAPVAPPPGLPPGPPPPPPPH